uniref:SGNH hydrolase-type esterase domain-containing protein n=1 Tax=uncultured Thiotrichaceae bacterium TaxID=298394 RepID=A0A6S6UFC6_9GAMM|nr:MAG: Unknown protein [uncultured Thiotrichaceae bacterium]
MKRICFIGDSITEGHSDNARLGWVGRLAQSLPSDFGIYNLGVSAQTLAQFHARAKIECGSRLDDYEHKGIVLGAGLNDLCKFDGDVARTSIEVIQSTLHELLDDLMEVAPLITVGPFPIAEEFNPFFSASLQANTYFSNTFIKEVDQLYAESCKARNIPYLSMVDALLNSDYMESLRENDGIHPKGEGYQIAAGLIQHWGAWQALSSTPTINSFTRK